MKQKNPQARMVTSQKISYRQMADLLMQMQIEFHLLAESMPEDASEVTASKLNSDHSTVMQFDTPEFYLSLDLVRKEVCHG